MGYTITRTVSASYDEAVTATREALAEQGFGVLTEIDIAATLKKKLDVEVPPQIILGACRPPAAYAALQAEPSIGALLPCNVVVRSTEAGTLVEAIDPETMLGFAENPALGDVATDVRTRLVKALDSLS